MRELVIDPDDAGALQRALMDVVNREGHDESCALRCVPPDNLECGREHDCSVCDEDEEEDDAK